MGKVLDRARALENATAAQVEQVAGERSKLADLAEKILLARAPSLPDSLRAFNARANFPPTELQVFDALGWSKETLAKECGRAMGICRWAREAGTAADRVATGKALSQAEATLTKRGPELEKQIAELRQELAGLERSLSDARRDQERQERALGELKKLVPPGVKEQHAQAVAALAPLRSRVGELRSQIATLAEVESLDMRDPQDRERARLHAMSACQPEIAAGLAPTEPAPRVGPWDAYCARLQPRIGELQDELDAMQAQLDERKAAADALLDVYAR